MLPTLLLRQTAVVFILRRYLLIYAGSLLMEIRAFLIMLMELFNTCSLRLLDLQK